MPVYAQKWIDIGLSTEPANREVAEEGLRKAYEAANLEQPKEVIWFDSPMAAKRYIRDNNLPSGSACYGQHDAGWFAYYDFFTQFDELVEIIKPLEGQMQVAQNAGWWWPYDEAVLICERMSELHLDEQGRLHNEEGPAVAFPDGEAVYAVNGVRVPADIIEDPSSITTERIMDEDNAEVRRIMCELYGWVNFFRDSGAELLDEQTDQLGHPLRLWRSEALPDEPEPIVMVEVTNSTPEPDGHYKTYTLRVDPSHTNAFDAQASLFMMDTEVYAPELET